MNLLIRRARQSDAAEIIQAHIRSIREICSKDYNPAQIAAWSGRDFREERWHQTMDRDLVWVISDADNKVYGFGHLEFRKNAQAEVAGLYFAPEVIGKGMGKKMMAIIFDECRKQAVKRVTLCATKTAKKFYESVGFQQIGEASTIALGGQHLECYNMESWLNNLNEIQSAYWQRYLSTLPEAKRPSKPFVTASYAGTREITDELLNLYLIGKKCAGSSIVEDFKSTDDPLPKVGNYWIFLDSKDNPSCILRTEKVATNKFYDVPVEIAIAEGEGDLSLEYWRKVHRELYSPYLASWGVQKLEDATVITEFFNIVFK